jgi:hypothetical protein
MGHPSQHMQLQDARLKGVRYKGGAQQAAPLQGRVFVLAQKRLVAFT